MELCIGTIALQEPGHGSGVVATQAQRDEGREWSWYTVGERIGKSRLPWGEPWISANGDLTSVFSIWSPARTLTGQITEEAGRQGDPSLWSKPVSLATESRAGCGSKGATPLSQCLTHLSLSKNVLNELCLIVIGLNAVPSNHCFLSTCYVLNGD